MVPILVLGAILLFLVTDLIVQKYSAKHKAIETPAVKELAPDALSWDISIPEGLFVSNAHSWASIQASGEVRTGIDDFARQMIGQVEAIDLPKVGSRLKAGAPMLTLYKGGSLAHIASPVDGEVKDLNTDATANPKAVSKDPYGEGWLVLLKPDNLAADLKNLRVASDARVFENDEVKRFRSFDEGHKPQVAIAADGGAPVQGIATVLGSHAWDEFRRDFLQEKI